MREIGKTGRVVLKAGLRVMAGAAALACAAWPALAADEVVMKSGNVSYVAGGVGEESLQRMRALAKDFNLQLLFAAKAGNYLADVTVSIRDARGANVLEATAGGPFLLARLAPGKYEVVATLDGVSVRQKATVAGSGLHQLVFRWDVRVDWAEGAPQRR
jgi:hypothetical protein